MSGHAGRADALLDVAGLTKSFGGVTACSDVDMQVRAGQILGIIGPNGAGKTTVFNCIAGTHRPDSGEVYFDGRRVDRLTPDRTTRRGIARTFQNLRPFLTMTLLENVAVGALCRIRRVEGARRRAMEILDYVGLADQHAKQAGALSTGQRKRLELARALATGPSLLLLDEVTAGVDPSAIPGLVDLVRRLRDDGLTLLVIEHNMQVIRELSDRLLAMHLGKVIADGAPTKVVQDPQVVDAYLGARHAERR